MVEIFCARALKQGTKTRIRSECGGSIRECYVGRRTRDTETPKSLKVFESEWNNQQGLKQELRL